MNEWFSSHNFQEKSMIKMQLGAMPPSTLAMEVNLWMAVHFKAGEANSLFFSIEALYRKAVEKCWEIWFVSSLNPNLTIKNQN